MPFFTLLFVYLLQVGTLDIGRVFRRIQKVLLTVEVTNSSGMDFIEEMEVLLSRKSGYLFVITHKPVYK